MIIIIYRFLENELILSIVFRVEFLYYVTCFMMLLYMIVVLFMLCYVDIMLMCISSITIARPALVNCVQENQKCHAKCLIVISLFLA